MAHQQYQHQIPEGVDMRCLLEDDNLLDYDECHVDEERNHYKSDPVDLFAVVGYKIRFVPVLEMRFVQDTQGTLDCIFQNENHRRK